MFYTFNNSTSCSNALGILLHECLAHILKQMLKRLKGRVYNAVVEALDKTTTKNNWQKVKATSVAVVPQRLGLYMRAHIKGSQKKAFT